MNEYESLIRECLKDLLEISRKVQYNSMVEHPNQAQVQEMAELSARLKYTREAIS